MEVTMSFLSELPIYKTEKPFDIYREVPAGVPTSNCEFEEHNNIKAQNAREVQSSLGLDITGFKLLKAPSKVDISSIDFQDRASSSIMEYLRETISLVKDELGADRVLCFDWRLRRRTLTKVELSQQPHNLDYDRFEALETARIVHSDYSFDGGRARVERQLFNDELHKYSLPGWRIQFINVWRPFVSVVQDNPLALCDRRSVRREDLILVDKIHEDHWEEGLYLHNRPWHKWYWIPEQTSDEIILFVTWDSEEGETVGMYNMPWTSDFLKNIPDVSACPPHVSFMNPKAAPGFPARKSVEVRLMVFTRVDLTSVEKESVGTK